jgi:hypothetical protein
MADRLEAALQALAAAAGQIPRDTFDVQAVVNRVGRDPGQLFAWVRDETALAPYRGLLRGARGVLMDRVGNSLDRSMLLAALLRSAGHEVRLARASLSSDQAQGLVRALGQRATPPSAPDAAGGQLEAFFSSYSAKFGADANELRSATSAVRDADTRVGDAMADRASQQAAQLKRVLGPALDRLETPTDAERAASLADHWWVQVRQNAEWTDYDPLLSPQGPSNTPLEPVETRAENGIGDDLQHVLRIRIIAEFAADQQLQEQVVLDHTARLSEIADQRMEIIHVPAIAPPVFDGSVAPVDGGNTLTTWLRRDDQRWTPVLTIGSRDIAGESLGLSGISPAKPPSPLGGFLGAFGGDDEVPAAPPQQLTAEFIEYELLTPGQKPLVERRAIFDWIGAAARDTRRATLATVSVSNRAGLLTAVEILPLIAQPSVEYAASLNSAAILKMGRAAVRILRSTAQASQMPGPDATEPHWHLHDLALARRTLQPLDASALHLVRGNVLTRLVGTRPRPDGAFEEWTAYDVVFNSMEKLSGSAPDRRDAAIAQGVLDTNAEVLPRGGDGPMTNISDWMARSGMTEDAWQVLTTPGAASSLANASPHLRVLIERDLAAGHVVVVPNIATGTDDIGWWRIARDGTVLGMNSDGRGGAAQVSENSLAQETAIRNRRQVYEMLKIAMCVAAVVKKNIDFHRAGGHPAAVLANNTVSVTACMVGGSLKIKGLRGSLNPGASSLQAARLSETGDIIQIAAVLYNWTVAQFIP